MKLWNRTFQLLLLAPALLLTLSACGGDPASSPSFDELRAEYDSIEGRIFPASRTAQEDLPSVGGVYEGAVVLAYYENGEDFTETAAARIRLFVDFIEDDISGEVTFITRASGAPITGMLIVRDSPILGHDFTAPLVGELVIGGEVATVEGAIDGSFWTPSGSSDEGGFAYGNIQFSAGPGSHRFGGTFATER